MRSLKQLLAWQKRRGDLWVEIFLDGSCEVHWEKLSYDIIASENTLYKALLGAYRVIQEYESESE